MQSLSGRIEGGMHLLPVRIYYEDTDTAGIVYHANYLRYAERARTEMLRLAGIEQGAVSRQQGLAFAVRGFSADYRRPARLDDLLEVRSRLLRLGAASLDAEQTIVRDETELVRIEVRIACVGRDGRPARMPADLKASLQPYCQVQDQS